MNDPFELREEAGEWCGVVSCDAGWREPLDVEVTAQGVVGEPSAALMARIREIVAGWRQTWPAIVAELAAMAETNPWDAVASIHRAMLVVREDSERWTVGFDLHGRRHDGRDYFVDLVGRTVSSSDGVD